MELVTEGFLNHLYVPISTISAIICNWEEHQSVINRPCTGAPRKISNRALKVIQKSSPGAKDHLNLDFQNPERVITEKTGNAPYCYGLHAPSPRKTPLLRKTHVEACLKFTTQHLEMPVDYWENVVWSDQTEVRFFHDNLTIRCLEEKWLCI